MRSRLAWRSSSANPILRTLTVCATGWILLFQGFLTLDTLYASRHLGLSPGQIGIAHMVGGGGAMLAAVAARQLTRRFGMGLPIMIGIACAGASWILIALIEPGPYAFALLGVCLFLLDLGVTTYWINYSTLRQSVTPDAMLGRMTARMRFFQRRAGSAGRLLRRLDGRGRRFARHAGLAGCGRHRARDRGSGNHQFATSA